MTNTPDNLALLRLLHLADSALPIGATPHSFGLETLTFEGNLMPPQVFDFFRDYLSETGVFEATFLRAGWACFALADFDTHWANLNDQYAAFKPARESRQASQTLGRRLLELVLTMDSEVSRVQQALACPVYHSLAFGLAARALEIDADSAALAFLHQMVAGLLSACQRLMPFGQRQASQTLWTLKPIISETAQASREVTLDDITCFTPLIDLASMRHPLLETRLFIS
jgi:urease accessory protein